MSERTRYERDRRRGEALRELSRAERQLLAALASAESADARERAAAEQALAHAEARVSHAIANLDRIAREAGDEAEGAGLAETGPSERRPGGRAPKAGAALSAEQIDGYVEEVADLARQCAVDVQDLRALLDAVARLGTRQDEDAIVAGPEPVPFPGRARAPDASAPAPVDTDEAGRTPAELESIRRRAALRALARQQGGEALDELAFGLAAIEGRLDEMSRSGALRRGTGPAPAGERTPVGIDRAASIGVRLTAIEERLTALERRMRWSEEPPGGDSKA